MDQPVGEELQLVIVDEKIVSGIPFAGYEDFWSWVARVDKLNYALETCQS